MKKVFVLFSIFIFFGNIINAQYHHMIGNNNVWDVFSDQVGEGGATYPVQTFADTIINGKLYKHIMGFGDGYIREDTTTEKVFYFNWSDSTEICILDFLLHKNDSIFLDFNTIFSDSYQDGYYFVDSTYSVIYGSDTLKYIVLSNPINMYDIKLIWIESIGSLFGPEYLNIPWLAYWGPLYTCTDFNIDLICAYKDCVKTYENICWQPPYLVGECDVVTVGINEYMAQNKYVEIYPNPVYDKSFLKYNIDIEYFEYEIFNSIGQQIKIGEAKNIEINKEDFDNGLYFLILISNQNISYKISFIIQ